MNIHHTLIKVGTDEQYLSVIPLDVIRLIVSYTVEPKMKLLNWIPLNKINWNILSAIPNAIHLLEQNIDKINWNNFSENPNIFEIDTKQLKLDITEKAKIIDDIIYE